MGATRTPKFFPASHEKKSLQHALGLPVPPPSVLKGASIYTTEEARFGFLCLRSCSLHEAHNYCLAWACRSTSNGKFFLLALLHLQHLTPHRPPCHIALHLSLTREQDPDTPPPEEGSLGQPGGGKSRFSGLEPVINLLK